MRCWTSWVGGWVGNLLSHEEAVVLDDEDIGGLDPFPTGLGHRPPKPVPVGEGVDGEVGEPSFSFICELLAGLDEGVVVAGVGKWVGGWVNPPSPFIGWVGGWVGFTYLPDFFLDDFALFVLGAGGDDLEAVADEEFGAVLFEEVGG